MHKLLILFFCIFSTIQNPNPGSVSISNVEQKQHSLRCCETMKSILAKLKQLDEVNDLIDKILEKGPLSIEMNRHLSKEFEGYWSSSNRTIYITKNHNDGSLMTTLLFEMHNAVNDSELDRLDQLAAQRKLNRKQYIEAVERWEYENAKATTKILNKGIRMGLFPRDCYWPISEDFENHFRCQKSAGHSAHIGKMYDILRYG